MAESNNQLVRGLTLVHSTSIVICTVIGTGVLLKSAVMAQYLNSPFFIIAAWIIAGLITMTGALTIAELGAMMPKAGGQYVYLRAAFGDMPAFLWGWMVFTGGVAAPAALSIAFATFLLDIFPINDIWITHTFIAFNSKINWQFGMLQVIAVAVIIFCSAINCMRVVFSGQVQTVLTIIKLTGISVIIGGVFFFPGSGNLENISALSDTQNWNGLQAFGAALIAALWAYHGWGLLVDIAGEVKHPGRNIPRALIIAILIIIIFYVLVNLAYFYALPFKEIISSNSTLYPDALPVASKAAQTFLGPIGKNILTIFFIFSIFGALHSEMLGVPRIFYTMARDGIFFSRFGNLSKGTHIPLFSLGVRTVFACSLACSGTFDQLTTLIIFTVWSFLGLSATSVFVLRRKMPDAPRPYRTLGYPVVPLIFIVMIAWLAFNTIQTNPVESIFGILLIFSGLPLYFYFRYKKRQENAAIIEKKI